jgi:hypothetical protein
LAPPKFTRVLGADIVMESIAPTTAEADPPTNPSRRDWCEGLFTIVANG